MNGVAARDRDAPRGYTTFLVVKIGKTACGQAAL
jgi:hypothetical protein